MDFHVLPIIIVVIFLFITLMLVVFVVIKSKRRKTLSTESLQYIKSHWIRIIDSFASHPANAVMDADKILDYVLRMHGFTGSMADKLKKAGPRFRDLNAVWSAHKLRNRIAHELGTLDRSEAKTALKHFKSALNDLGAEL